MITEEGPDGLPIRHFFPAEVADIGQVNFRRTPDMIAFFNDLFGPYPFEAYGVVVAKTQLGFALENQTLSLFGLDHIGALAQWTKPPRTNSRTNGSAIMSVWRRGGHLAQRGFATYASWLWFEHEVTRVFLSGESMEAYDADCGRYADVYADHHARSDRGVGGGDAAGLRSRCLPQDVTRITELLLTAHRVGRVRSRSRSRCCRRIPFPARSCTRYLTVLPFESVQLTSTARLTNFSRCSTCTRFWARRSIFRPAAFCRPDSPTQRDLFNRGIYCAGR